MKTLLLGISFFVTLSSCEQKITHEQSLTYILSVRGLMQDAKSNVETFWQEMKKAVLTAKQNPNSKLEKSRIDTLQNQLTAVIADLDSKIKKLRSIAETDKRINLSEKTLVYLTEIKKMQENDIPLVLQLLEHGLDKITPEQQAAVKGFLEDGKAMQLKSSDLQNLFFDYYKKYEITEDELKKNGL